MLAVAPRLPHWLHTNLKNANSMRARSPCLRMSASTGSIACRWQILVRVRVAIKQDVVGAAATRVVADAGEIGRYWFFSLLDGVDQPAVAGSASGYRCRRRIAGITEAIVGKLRIQPGPGVGR